MGKIAKWVGELVRGAIGRRHLLKARDLVCLVKGLLYLAVLGGQLYLHVQSILLVFLCCVATGAFEFMFWEILQKLPEL